MLGRYCNYMCIGYSELHCQNIYISLHFTEVGCMWGEATLVGSSEAGTRLVTHATFVLMTVLVMTRCLDPVLSKDTVYLSIFLSLCH